MKKILITGADGFIAQKLASLLSEKGYVLIGQTIYDGELPHFHRTFKAKLTEPLPDDVATHSIEGVIHCAHYKGENEYEVNVSGTQMWAEQLSTHVHYQIFLSSISARRVTESTYGRIKYDLEQWFMQKNQIVLRPGLVIGKGGLFARMNKTIQTMPVVPLIDGGRQLVYFIGIEPLVQIIFKMIQSDITPFAAQPWNLFQNKPITLREILSIAGKINHKKVRFIFIPSKWISIILGLYEKTGLWQLPFDKNNLIGLRQNEDNPYVSDYLKFDYPEYPFEDLVSHLSRSSFVRLE